MKGWNHLRSKSSRRTQLCRVMVRERNDCIPQYYAVDRPENNCVSQYVVYNEARDWYVTVI